jgi:hypothetical protein
VLARAGPTGAADFFKGFDGDSCDVVVCPLDLFAAVWRVLEAFALPFPGDLATVGPTDEGLDDFLCDFLDIRLPFVAFGGSMIGVL